MVPGTVERTVKRYLSAADRLLPGRITAFYVGGSVALGAFREGRSDVDFVAVVDGDLAENEVRRLRALHILSGAQSATLAVRCGHSPLTGTCNGVFVRSRDLARPVSEIAPVASHSGVAFAVGKGGSDVSPVAWKVLQERGIPMRGAAPSSLPLVPQPELLSAWNVDNLHSYWRPWASAVQRSPRARSRLRPRWSTAWGALGPPRLHHTITTGAVISKEEAGEYALDVFASRWHPLIQDALAYRRMERAHDLGLSAEARCILTAEFVLEVVDSVGELHGASTEESRRCPQPLV